MSYTLIIEGNVPSMRYALRQGFKLHHTLVMTDLAVFKEMDVESKGRVRLITSEDLDEDASIQL